MAEPPQGALRYVASHAAQAPPEVLLHRHFAVDADLRAAVGRLALLLELEGADVFLPAFQVWKVAKPAIARTFFLSMTPRTPPALARLPEPIATCQTGGLS